MLIYALEINVAAAMTRRYKNSIVLRFCFYTDMKDLKSLTSDSFLYGFCKEPYDSVTKELTDEAHHCILDAVEKFRAETSWPFIWLYIERQAGRICFHLGQQPKLELYDKQIGQWKMKHSL